MAKSKYDAKEYKDLVKKVVDQDSEIIKASSHLKENYNVDLEITDEGDITLQAANDCLNESQSLLDAKAYILENLDDSYYTNIMFI